MLPVSLQAPFFHINKIGLHTETRGIPSCYLGHKVGNDKNTGPDGVFAEWMWDGHALRVRNDRYGFYPIFYFCKEQEICLSTSIPALLSEGAPPELDGPS